MASQLWAVLCQHPAWLLTLPRPKCRRTWPTVLLLLVMLLDMDGNMPVAPHWPPTTVTFQRRWHSRACRQPEKVVTRSQLPHSDGSSGCNSITRAPSAHPPHLPSLRSHPPPLPPFCLESWFYGLTSFVLMTLKYFLP